ncbi:MAG: hypothetical protein HS122_12900 [Opitutaceae bacterium]|nr:hypothetical protein [Opitutaceae bacterium]
MSGLTGAVAVSSGQAHVLVLKSDGSVWSWRNNASGQLGDGTTTSRTSPVRVSADQCRSNRRRWRSQPRTCAAMVRSGHGDSIQRRVGRWNHHQPDLRSRFRVCLPSR